MRWSRAIAAVLTASSVAAVALAWGAWELSKSPTHQLFGELVTRVETARPVVALSFDDGPGAGHTEDVLDLLAAEQVRATFFVVGRAVAARPDLASRIVRDGHELGNHSYSHGRMVLKSPGFVRREIDETDRLIRGAGQAGAIQFRPPYSKRLVVLPWMLARQGRPVVLADVQPDSIRGIADDPAAMATHVKEHVRAGSIILMHVEMGPRDASRAALPGVIEAVRSRGLEFVTITELMAAASP